MRFLLVVLLAAPLAVSVATPTNPGATDFVWQAVTTDINGNPATVEYYSVYCGSQSGNYTAQVDTTSTTLPISDVVTDPGEYYCAVTASASGGESGYSNEVHFFIEAGTLNVLKAGIPAVPGSFGLQ